MSHKRELGEPIKTTFDNQKVSFVIDGTIEGHDSELGVYTIRGNSRGAQHLEWVITAHWATDFYAWDGEKDDGAP